MATVSSSIGQKSFTLDWWSGTVGINDVDDGHSVASRIAHILGGEWDAGHGMYNYAKSLRHPSGAVILYQGRLDMGVHVSLNSEALAFFSENVPKLWETFRFRCTRIDLCADTSDISVDEILKDTSIIVCRSRLHSIVYDIKSGGKTLYVGSPRGGGRKVVRIYDKAAESNLPGVLTRIEVQLRSDYANAAFQYVLGGGNIADVVVRAIDFRLPEPGASQRRTAKWCRAQWWASLLGDLTGGFKFPVRAVVSDVVERAYSFVVRQCARSLAVCRLAFGESFVTNVVSIGMKRLSSAQSHYIIATSSPP